jgi:hypothetical protein
MPSESYVQNPKLKRIKKQELTTSLGCTKEYSYEGGFVPVLIQVTDGYISSQTIKVVLVSFIHSTNLMAGRLYGFAYTYTKEIKKVYVDGKFRFIVR